MRMVPVTGALVIAEKYPAIPRTTKSRERTPVSLPQIAPRSAPMVRRGKKIPPGVPEA